MHAPDPRMTAETEAFEKRLRSWSPAASTIDRDRLLYEAGRAAAAPVSPTPWTWRIATAAAALIALGLGLAWQRERTHAQDLAIALVNTQRTMPANPASALPPLQIAEDAANHTHPRPLDPSSYFLLTRGEGAPDAAVSPRQGTVHQPQEPRAVDASLILRYRGREPSVLFEL